LYIYLLLFCVLSCERSQSSDLPGHLVENVGYTEIKKATEIKREM